MRKRKSICVSVLLVGLAWCSGGCIDAVTTGFTEGLNSAISAAVEAIIGNALEPITATE